MKNSIRNKTVGVALAAACLGTAWNVAPAWAASKRVATASDPVYVKECGACHMAFSPELLPARSWQRLMNALRDHFGESAQLDETEARRITDYLTAHAADRATNEQSVEVMRSLGSGDAPLRITEVPYIAGLHASALDPVRGGNPRPKTLAECSVCHQSAVETGSYTDRHYSVSDEAFRNGATQAH